MDISGILSAVGEVTQLETLLIITLGVFIGIIAGCIPGFTFTMALVLAFPFTFGMEPIQGLSLMIGIYIGGLSGGLIAGVLLGIPGTPSSVVTIFDGFPMTQKGEASRALGIGILSSVVGTIFGALILFALGPVIATFTLRFGPWEIFSLVLFALTLIAGLSNGHFIKGLIAGCMGLLISTIGVAPSGQMRFDFNMSALAGGIDILPVLIGLFAISQLLTNVEDIYKQRNIKAHNIKQKIRIPFLTVIKDMVTEKWNVLRSSLIGCFIGTLPAAGAETANFISYDQAKKAAKKPKEYGKGHPGGVVASETSNSAVAGGAFIPTITLGIPGDVAQAVMMGALILHGITPGPGLFEQQPVLVNSIYVSIIISAFLVLILQTALLPFLARVTIVPKSILVPSILVVTAVGSFALNNRIFDIWIVFVFGVIGYLLTKLDIPLGPIILGLILGSTLEAELMRAMQLSDNVLLFVTRPISLIFLLLAVASIIFSIYQENKQKKKLEEAEAAS